MSTTTSNRATQPVSASVQRRITGTLFITQSLFRAAMIASFTLMPIVAVNLTGNESFAGVPNTLLLIGAAAMAYPLGWLMDQAGRRIGLLIGYILAGLGSILSVFSIISASFIGFCAGAALFGMGRGVSEQSRFIAAEIYRPERQARIISFIVWAGTVGAIGGPIWVEPSTRFAERIGFDATTGPYILSAIFSVIALILIFLFLRPDPKTISSAMENEAKVDKADLPTRSLSEIFANPTIQIAILSMIIGQLVMTMIMVITPLHMDHHHHATQAISWVIMAHTIGMFGLSSVTGWLIERLGQVKIIVLGGIVLVNASFLSPLFTDAWMLGVALFLLGIGWNFCFIAGSSLLSQTLLPDERGKVQGANEAMVSLASGLGSLGTGIAFAQGGILAVSVIGLAFSMLLIIATLWSRQWRLAHLPT